MEAPFFAPEGKNLKTITNLKIEKIVNRGHGLGFADSRPVFVSGTMPGDVVDVSITQERKTVSFGTIERIVTPAPQRQQPDCEVFETCGGCNWLHMPYATQLYWMQEIVDELFRHLPIEKSLPIYGGEAIHSYRNKSYFPVGSEAGVPVAGLFAAQSHTIVPHKKCLLLPPEFDAIAQAVITFMKAADVKPYDEKKHAGCIRHIGVRRSSVDASLQVIVVTHSGKLPFSRQLVRVLLEQFPTIKGVVQNINAEAGNRILGNREKILFGSAYLDDVIGGKPFHLHYRSFFQVNHNVAEELYGHVKSQLGSGKNVVDAYAGAGTIGIFCADDSRKVYCLENNAQACDDARKNCILNNAENVEILQGDVEETMSRLLSEHPVDTVIFDPPRKGVDAESLQKLIQARIPRIIYVSCDPATQARDCAILAKGGYHLVTAKAFDMFPQTYHIEHVVTLQWHG